MRKKQSFFTKESEPELVDAHKSDKGSIVGPERTCRQAPLNNSWGETHRAGQIIPARPMGRFYFKGPACRS